MAANHHRSRLRLLLPWLCLLLRLVGDTDLLLAADAGTSSTPARDKLARLLVCQQAEKDAALADQRAALTKISDIESFIGSLSDRPVHHAAHEKAGRALTVARETLAKIEERIRLIDLKQDLTLRAIRYLPSTEGRPEDGAHPSDRPRQDLNRKANADSESQTLDGILSHEFGFIADAAEVRRLESLVTRLQMLSPRPDVPITVRIVDDTGHPPSIAAATSTTIYFWKSYLDRHPSDSELLFIAGHELAHVQLGHYAETLIGKETDRQRLLQDLGAEAAQSIGWRTEEILHKLRTAPWERQQEEAADLLGAQQALEARALPQGIQEALSHMHQDEQLRARSLPPDAQRYRDSLRDHPKPLDRLKALEQAFGEKFWDRTSLKMPLACHHK